MVYTAQEEQDGLIPNNVINISEGVELSSQELTLLSKGLSF